MKIKRSYEDIYGDKADYMREKRRKSTKKTWQDPEVRKSRCITISKSMKGKNYTNGSGSFRKRALEHYGCKCQKCGYDKYISVLDVHHKDYNRKNNKLKNLMVLCVRCHIERHIEDNRRFGTRSLENKIVFGEYKYIKGGKEKCQQI